MKILHTIGALTKGGAEKQCKLLMNEHSSMGHEIAIVYFYDDFEIEKNPKIQYFQIKRGGKFSLISICSQLRKIFETFQPDIVHNWLPEIITIPSALMSRWFNIPNISSQRRVLQRNVDFFDSLRDYFILLNHLMANKVICNFDYKSEKILTKNIIKYKKGICIKNGFELDFPKERKIFSFLREDAIKIIFTGRLVAQKNVDILIRAVASLKSKGISAQIVIFGEGTLENQLKNLSSSLGFSSEDIYFAGYLSNWHEYVHNFDLFILPTNAEGMPNVLIEAMNLKIPTIASDIPEISSLFDHGKEVYLVDEITHLKLAQAIEELSNNSELRLNLTVNAHEKIKEFSAQRMANHFYECYKSLVD